MQFPLNWTITVKCYSLQDTFELNDSVNVISRDLLPDTRQYYRTLSRLVADYTHTQNHGTLTLILKGEVLLAGVISYLYGIYLSRIRGISFSKKACPNQQGSFHPSELRWAFPALNILVHGVCATLRQTKHYPCSHSSSRLGYICALSGF